MAESWVIALIVLLVLLFIGGLAVLCHSVSPFKLLYYLIVRTPAGDWYLAAQLRKFPRPHSSSVTHEYATCLIRTVAFLEDNYAYLIIDRTSGAVAVVDPGDAVSVSTSLSALSEAWTSGQLPSVQSCPHLTHLLVTHYHYDHAGGVPALARAHPGVTLVHSSGEYSRHIAATDSATTPRLVVTDGHAFTVGDGVNIRVLGAPCHTKGHILFRVDLGEGATALFSGDTLFSGGVGKFFEGEASDMYDVLYDVLPHHGLLGDGGVRLFPGHEYASDNVSFAAWLQPDDERVRAKLSAVREARAAGVPTVASLLRDEMSINPYLRVHEREVQDAVRAQAHLLRPALAAAVRDGTVGARAAQINVMAALRALKDAKVHVPNAGTAAAAAPPATTTDAEDKKA